MRRSFEDLCEAMADPAFYPHSVSQLERRDTHISAVFLTGEWVYKLKKPVDLGFLDYRNLEDRHYFCKQEVLLNQRLSRDVYQEVIKVYEDETGQFSMVKKGRVAEYAVKMRQLPDSLSLKELLQNDKIRQMDMDRLGRMLAAFYKGGEQSPAIEHYGRRGVIAFNMEESFRQLGPFAGRLLEPDKWEVVCQVSRSFLESRRDLFQRRIEAGRIRDGHGDLRADHVYFFRGIQIIDCIEFNDRFRYGDVAADLAFLHMDMEHLGYGKWSRSFLAAYVNDARDPGLYSLLDFYAAYRAIVRLKVACLRWEEVKESEQETLAGDARVYLNQAYRYAIEFSRPTLWVFCGLPATGKSSLAEEMAKTLGVFLFQSDRIRRGDQNGEPRKKAPFGQGLYRLEMRHRVYTRMLALAQQTLKTGRSVILDATYSRRNWRDETPMLASDLDTNLVFVECLCKEETIRSRLRGRTNASLSDARMEHLAQIREAFEATTELPEDMHLSIRTDKQPLHETLVNVLSEGYARKCAQVKRLIAVTTE
jgi:aminoglycoside phosphotransferase family enzyme/predicted kinase